MKKYLLPLLGAALYAGSALAVPAAPGLMERIQPDGSKVWFTLHGDENLSWATSPDGYTLLPDEKGFWTVAVQNNIGELVASDIRYVGNSARTLAPHIAPGLRFTPAQANRIKRANAIRRTPAASTLQIESSFPSTGQRKMLMILVNFSDRTTTKTREDFDNYMNQEGYGGIGSFRDFYLENSYGKLDITTTVTPWVKLPYASYQCSADNVGTIIAYALDYLQKNGTINIADFDNDGDGVLDGLAVIHQGGGQEATGSLNDIWSHTGHLSGLKVGGISINSYTIQPEILGNTTRQSTIGVMCHEFGHNLGAPDFYDVDYETGGSFPGTGNWDLMASGSWNGDLGDRPAGVNMWQKIQYGWVEPTVLTDDISVTAPDAAFNPTGYRLNTSEPGDYFIIENRQNKSVFDQALPGHGLIIYHANEKGISEKVFSNLVNAAYPQYMYTVCASAGTDPKNTPESYGSLATAAFPSTKLNYFDDTTLPSTKSVNGRYAYCGIYDIAQNSDGTMRFNYKVGERPETPSNLKATVERGVVSLTWDFADMARLDHFTVYRNGVEIAQTRSTSYIDHTDESGMLAYNVDATLRSGLVSGYEEAAVRIPVNHITYLDAQADPIDGVSLQWNLNTRLSHMTSNPTSVSMFTADGNSAEMAHRFRAEEIAPYDGYIIKNITFAPMMSKSQASYTLRVWQADPDGLNPEIVSERKVTNFGLGQPTQVTLTTKPAIQAGKEIWISVLVDSTVGYVEYPEDYTNLTEGLGNWVRIGDGNWQPAPNAHGDFYLYAGLTAPAANHDKEAPLLDFTDPYNPWADLSYPIGFAVYRNNELVGTTSSRFFADKSVATGSHTYDVVSLYKDGNMSKPSSVNINIVRTGTISIVDTPVATVRTSARTITVDNWSAEVAIFNVAGMCIYRTTAFDGRAIAVTPGVYMVRTGATTTKVIVK